MLNFLTLTHFSFENNCPRADLYKKTFSTALPTLSLGCHVVCMVRVCVCMCLTFLVVKISHLNSASLVPVNLNILFFYIS